MKCGLLGRKLAHSYSPMIHEYLGNYSYDLLEAEPEMLESIVKSGQYQGLNVTIPYKKVMIPLCDSLTNEAAKLGAVNTLVINDKQIIGHNSDYQGFKTLLASSTLSVNNKKVLVLGSGGSSVTVQCVLQEQGANVVVISRTGANNYGNLHLHKDASVIINCTPVSVVGESKKNLIENCLGSMAAFALFDEGGAEA